VSEDWAPREAAETDAAPILVVGSIALDTIETPFETRTDVLGGAGAHFSAAASLFAPVRLVGVVGGDFPMDELELLRSRGVDLRGLEVAEGSTFRWRGRYHLDMNERDTLQLDLGVFAGFRPRLSADAAGSSIVFLANIDPDIQLHVLDQAAAPRITACDTIDHWIEEKRDAVDRLFSRVDMVFLNEDEARLYADTPNLQRAARQVLATGCRTVLIKKGENGALVVRSHDSGEVETFALPAYPLEEVVDPTGAGDAFAGGVLGSLAASRDFEQRSLRRAVAVGTVVASFAVEDFGPKALERVDLDSIKRRYDLIRSFAEVPVLEGPTVDFQP
jgi:sugar/nucleoside kinase (ribokinase family)